MLVLAARLNTNLKFVGGGCTDRGDQNELRRRTSSNVVVTDLTDNTGWENTFPELAEILTFCGCECVQATIRRRATPVAPMSVHTSAASSLAAVCSSPPSVCMLLAVGRTDSDRGL